MTDRNDRAVNINLAFKVPCRVATDANVTLWGLQTIDGHTLVEGERVLCTGQTDATQNGIYVATSGLWYRAPDARSNRDLRKGCRVIITDGVLYEQTEWQLTSTDPHVIDVSDQTWEQYCQTANPGANGYSIYLFDECCHLFVSADTGSTWAQKLTPTITLNDSWSDMSMAVNDEDYTTVGLFNFTVTSSYSSDFDDARGGVEIADADTTDTADILSYSYGVVGTNYQQAYSGAISENGTTILIPVFSADDLDSSYPRLSTDGGATWSNVTALGSGASWTRACFSASADVMYIHKAETGIYKSTDSGSTWSALTNSPAFTSPSGRDAIGSFNTLRLRCSTTGEAVAAVNYIGEFWISTDSGSTWTETDFPSKLSSDATHTSSADFGMSSDGSTIIVAITNSSSGSSRTYTWLSTDTGSTWTAVSPTNQTSKNVFCVNVSPDGNGLVVVYDNGSSTSFSTADALLDISTDQGSTWSEATFAMDYPGSGGDPGLFVSAYIMSN